MFLQTLREGPGLRPDRGHQPDQAGDQQPWEAQLGQEAEHACGKAGPQPSGRQRHRRHDLPHLPLKETTG